jgi:hypothetical protein
MCASRSFLMLIAATLCVYMMCVAAMPIFVCDHPVSGETTLEGGGLVIHYQAHWHPECSWGTTTAYRSVQVQPGNSPVREYRICV